MFDSRGSIKKTILTFMTKFFLLVGLHHILPTNDDNVLTWDRAVLVEALVVGLEIYVAKVVITVIDESVFKTSTSYPFACISSSFSRIRGTHFTL